METRNQNGDEVFYFLYEGIYSEFITNVLRISINRRYLSFKQYDADLNS